MNGRLNYMLRVEARLEGRGSGEIQRPVGNFKLRNKVVGLVIKVWPLFVV